MQYNKRGFGDAKNSLTLNPYFDDFSTSSPDPTEELYLTTEAEEFYQAENNDFLIAEQLA